jgi:hypothetical protein
MVAIPSFPQSHLQVAVVVEPSQLLLRANLVDRAAARRLVLVLQIAAVLVLQGKAITVAIVVRHMPIQIMLAVAVVVLVAQAETLLLGQMLVVVLAVMQVQALPHHYQAPLLFTHMVLQAVAIIMAMGALRQLALKAGARAYQHLLNQAVAVMVALKRHGQAATAAPAS